MSVSSENSGGGGGGGGGVGGARAAVSPAVSAGDYAPSPNTCSQALARANQLRVQALLRQLLVVQEPQQQIDTLRVLRKTLRELDYHLSWLTQVDFLEALERILREENESDVDWRLINDATQLLIESIPRLAFDVDPQTVGQILISVVQNLGHQRSEVRRSSLLLMNMYINERPAHFQQVLKIFIDYGLANHRNAQAQRGAILSLPLLMTEQVVEGEDLLPLIKCLSELLVDADAQLFYSLYLALQRLHLTVGDQQFGAYLRNCDPEASLLYKQAASRNNSLASGGQDSLEQQAPQLSCQSQRRSSKAELQQQQEELVAPSTTQQEASEPKQVTFEDDSSFLPERRAKQQQSSGFDPLEEQQQTVAATSGAMGSEQSDSLGSANDEELLSDQQQRQAGRRLKHQHHHHQQHQQHQQRQMIDSSGSSSPAQSISECRRELQGGARGATGGGAHARPFERQSSVSSTCSSEAKLVDPSHYMNAAALSGRPLSGYDEIHHVDHSSTGLAINDMGVCCTPTMELGPAAQNELKFGIFPRHLVGAALGSVAGGGGATSTTLRYQDRIEALQEMMCIIRDSPINHLAILMTYFDSFLEQFLGRLLGRPGADYKVELIAIDMIETIVIKTKISTIQYIRPMIGLLMRTLGDSRAIFRDNTIRVIYKMMAFLPPQHVIDAIFEHKHSKSALVREESVNRVTAAVLEYDKNEFNLTKLCYHVLPMLADHHANVRLASLECIATLANALGQERIGSLLTAAEAVQTGCDYDGLLDAINARLLRRALPRCNPDGSIRYVIKPFLNLANANYHQEHQAADVRWVLEAPSSHQHVGAHFQGLQQDQHHQHRQQHHRQQASLADLSTLDHHQQQQQHPHRPGVYSPPDASQRRRSSVSLCQLASCNELPGQHHHHHSVSPSSASQRQQQQTDGGKQRASGGSKRLSRADATCCPSKPADSQRKPSRAASGDLKCRQPQLGQASDNRSESQRARPEPDSLDSARGDQSQQAVGAADFNNIEQTTTATSPATRRRESGGAGALRRSNSQDSTSSTDTNKVLFQYYLSKFKQSLTETASNGTSMHSVLPSDSIIYTDSEQAYALTRQQSRYQQTSFDYDADSVGRVPGSVGPVSSGRQLAAEQQQQQRQLDLEPARRSRPASHEPSESSASESPLTVMEAAPGSGGRRPQQARSSAVEASSPAEIRRGSVHAVPDHHRRPSHHQQQEPVSDFRQRRQSLSRASEEQFEAAARRQSAAKMQQQQAKELHQLHQQQDLAASDRRKSGAGQEAGGGAECDSGGASSGSRRLQQRSSGSHESATTAASASSEPDQEQHQQSAKRSLTRQSASVFAHDEALDGSQPSSRKPSAAGGGADGEADTISSRRSLHSSGRRESVTTTDSQSSSQREFSDQANQTSAQIGSRESRRRRSRRRSSSSRQEHSQVVNNKEQQPDEIAGGNQAAESGEQQSVRSSRDAPESREIEIRRRASRSQPPPSVPSKQLPQQSSERHATSGQQASTLASLGPTGSGSHHMTYGGGAGRRAVSVSPSVASNVNIRHILENVADVEGPFPEAQLAFKVALSALDSPCWSTKVEGLLALIRLATFHQSLVLNHLHEVMSRVVNETRNLRSTVARSAIFVLGDMSSKLKRSIEPELDSIVQALLHKSIENTAFIRDDIRRALTQIVDNLTQWRLANSLIHQGASHKNMHVRRMASQFVAALVERMGPAKCLVGARDISAQLIPAAAKFAQDSSPHTRYYGRLILARIMQHGAFERLLRKSLTPNLYRSTVGIIESVKRRGAGDPPAD